jgi:ribosomal protection tetracycline resistance protein
MPVLAGLGGVPRSTAAQGAGYLIEGGIPAARVHGLRLRLPGLTRGEGVLECVFDRYQPVTGPPPSRSRSDHNPVNRKEYLLHVVKGVGR